MFRRTLFLLLCATCLSQISLAQPYFPDSSFLTDGINLVENITPMTYNHKVREVAVMPDGRIVMYGTSQPFGDVELIRLLPNGALDTSFSNDGYTNVYITGSIVNEIYNMKVLADGRIYLVGRITDGASSQMRVWALNANGTMNTSFGNNGIATATVNQWTMNVGGIDVQTDGKIILGGYVIDAGLLKHCVIRLNTNGTVDNSYSQNGSFICPFGFMNVICNNCSYWANDATVAKCQPDNKTLISGTYNITGWGSLYIARYLTNGDPDVTFSTDGVATIEIDTANMLPKDLHIDNNGNIYVVCLYSKVAVKHFAAFKFNSAGVQDMTYGVNGMAKLDSINFDYPYSYTQSMLQPDGKILLAGTRDTGNYAKYAVRRLMPNGMPDNSFGNNGLYTLYRGLNDICFGGALQPDGKILMVGGGKKMLNSDTTYAVCIRITDSASLLSTGNIIADKNTSLYAYPNPSASGAFTINYTISKPQAAYLQLTDVSGKVIESTKIQLQSAKGSFPYNMPVNTSQGNYYLRVSTEDGEMNLLKLVH